MKSKAMFFSAIRFSIALLLILMPILLLTPFSHPAAHVENPHIDKPSIDKPRIDKLDPPNWWINHTVNPVQLLIYGSNLNNARVTVDQPGVNVVSSTVSSNGRYIITYLNIDAQKATPGTFKITIANDQGTTNTDFSIAALPDTNGKYQGFNPNDLMYLIMVDRFADGDTTNNDPPISAGFYDRSKPRSYHGGDIQGIIDHLGYLKDLGVSAIWMTPIYDNANNTSDYHGYGSVDYYKVEEHFGDLAKLRTLVSEAHNQGIKIIQDHVLNHTGPTHVWTDNPPTKQFLNGTRQQHINNVFDIPSLVTPTGDATRVEATLRGWFADILPDINQDDNEAAQYLIQNSLWWIASTGIDGIRLDTFPYIPRKFWSKWNAAIHKQYPNFTVVGEVLDGRPGVVNFFQGGLTRFDGVDSGVDTVFDYPNCFAIRDFFARNQGSLTTIIDADAGYPKASVLVPFFGNHDIKRFASEPGANTDKMILAYTYLLTMRGTPQIYYGDELAIKGGEDPDNRKDFPGGFPNDPRSAFTSSGRTKPENKLFNAIRKVAQLRTKLPQLRGGEMKFLYDRQGLITYLRTRDNARAIVAINNTDDTAAWKVDLPQGIWADGTRLINQLDEKRSTVVKRGKIKIDLAPRQAAIFISN